MAAAYGNSAVVAFAERTDTTYTITGLAAGDLILIAHSEYIADGSTLPTPTPPDGFEEIAGAWPLQIVTDVTGLFGVWVWAKIAGAAEPGSYTVNHGDADTIGAIYYSDRNATTNPVDAVTQNSGTGTTTTYTDLPTSGPDELIVIFGLDGQDTGNTLTPPAGSTPTFTARAQTLGVFIADGVLAAGGATGDKTMTNNSSSSDQWLAVMIAIQPPRGGGFFF